MQGSWYPFDVAAPEKRIKDNAQRDAMKIEDLQAAIDGWRDWPGGKMLVIGPRGSGKTHLAQIWAAQSGARLVAARGLSVGVNLNVNERKTGADPRLKSRERRFS